MKKIFLVLLILLFGTFIYLKLQILGSPNSKFNQTTRYNLGSSGFMRTVLGLHNDGDARKEFLKRSGPIVIEWFKPFTDDVDEQVLKDFAGKVTENTGRATKIVYGGALDENTLRLEDLNTISYKAATDVAESGSLLLVFFTHDYLPRPEGEISSTYKENGMVISMTAHKDFVAGYGQYLNSYYVSSMLHEFGHQLGLEHGQDPKCIMSAHAGINGKPIEFYGYSQPKDYCVNEKEELIKIKSNFK